MPCCKWLNLIFECGDIIDANCAYYQYKTSKTTQAPMVEYGYFYSNKIRDPN